MIKLFERWFLLQNKQLVIAASQKLLIRPSNNFLEVKSNIISIRCLHNESELQQVQTDDFVNSESVKSLRKLFKCTEKEAIETHRILYSDPANMKEFRKILLWIHKRGASMPVIIRNCHILLVPLGNDLRDNSTFKILIH